MTSFSLPTFWSWCAWVHPHVAEMTCQSYLCKHCSILDETQITVTLHVIYLGLPLCKCLSLGCLFLLCACVLTLMLNCLLIPTNLHMETLDSTCPFPNHLMFKTDLYKFIIYPYVPSKHCLSNHLLYLTNTPSYCLFMAAKF